VTHFKVKKKEYVLVHFKITLIVLPVHFGTVTRLAINGTKNEINQIYKDRTSKRNIP